VSRDVRDRDQKNYTLLGPGPGPKEKLYRDQNRDRKKNYRDHDRDRDQRLNPRLYDCLNSVNFVRQKSLSSKKKSPKVLVVN
jgi:hypothetical protein